MTEYGHTITTRCQLMMKCIMLAVAMLCALCEMGALKGLNSLRNVNETESFERSIYFAKFRVVVIRKSRDSLLTYIHALDFSRRKMSTQQCVIGLTFYNSSFHDVDADVTGRKAFGKRFDRPHTWQTTETFPLTTLTTICFACKVVLHPRQSSKLIALGILSHY